jgi:hypothetical protein
MEDQFDEEPTWWQSAWGVMKEELAWLAKTLGAISVTLALGRLLSLIGKHSGIDTGALRGDWNSQVDQELQRRELEEKLKNEKNP